MIRENVRTSVMRYREEAELLVMLYRYLNDVSFGAYHHLIRDEITV